MKHRTYRLRDTLKHAGFCREWQQFVTRFKTFQEVVDYVQAHPGECLGVEGDGTLAYGVWYFVWWLDGCTSVGLMAPNSYQPVPQSLIDEAVRLWLAYADEHGLYEETDV